jgi:hypothetical protein
MSNRDYADRLLVAVAIYKGRTAGVLAIKSLAGRPYDLWSPLVESL